MSSRLFSSFITKIQNPCIKCVNYIKYTYTYPHDELYDPITKLGNCSLFGTHNLVTGNIIYEYALVCRNHESKCGKDGHHFAKIVTPTPQT